MNELFEFRKHIDIRKVSIFIVCFVLMIFVFIKFLPQNTQKELEKEADSNPYKTYYSSNKTFSLELPKRYNLKENYTDEITLLQSDDGLQIKIEERAIVLGKALLDIATSDKTVYLEKFENSFDVSDLKDFSLSSTNSLSGYTYSFNYIQNSSEYNIQVFWVQGNSKYYIITVCIPNNVSSNYEGIETEIISSFIPS